MEYKVYNKELKIREHHIALSADDFREFIKDKIPHVDLSNTDEPIRFSIQEFNITTHRGHLYPGKNRFVFILTERTGTLEPEL